MDEELHITDLIDVDILQQIQDSFSKMTGIASVTTDANGVAVTKGSNFSDFCFKYTRSTKIGCQRCEQCDKHGAETALKTGKAATYICHAGLVDFAAPIMAHGKMIGCFIGGQVLTENPDINQVLSVAKEIGVEPISYVQAAMRVNIVAKPHIDRAADFLYTIANILSSIAYHKYEANQANIEVQKSARMKSDFLANMSHEIRTPMNAVIGMAEMALREELPPTARDYINQIKDSGKTLLTIINDILDFSKIESGKMDIVIAEYEPMSIISDIASIISTRIGSKDIELVFDIDPNIPSKLLGDNTRIKQIIINIANNAVKFTKDGRVLLKISFSQASDDDEITLRVSVEDTGIGIKEEDLGKLFQSFSQVDSKRNRNIEGTGLGLAISKQLLSLMDGSISVESEYGVGSTFSFSLPQKVIDSKPSIDCSRIQGISVVGLVVNPFIQEQLQSDVVRLGADYSAITSAEELEALDDIPEFLFVEHILFNKAVEQFVRNHPDMTAILMINFHTMVMYNIPNLLVVKKPLFSQNIAAILKHEDLNANNYDDSDDDFQFIAPDATILVVDDNAINLTVAEGLLEPLKMNIDTALSGEEAIGKISAKHYDIIFMDHMMPELDGVETTHIIRRFHDEYNDVPIIALTANAVDGTKDMFLQEGMNDFVAKPIELNVIVSKIKKWLPPEKIQRVNGSQVTNEAPPPKKIEIEGLDTDAALALLGTESLFWTVLKDYYQVIKKKIKLIKEYEESENWPAYTIEVHALKSASKQIGATDLSEKAASMEKAGNARNAELIHRRTDAMLVEYNRYYEILQPYFPEESDTSTHELITTDALRAFFKDMRTALDELDLDPMEEIINEMKQFSYRDDQSELFEQLKNAVEEIDVDSCEDILKRWEALL
jgi:signal transduction histidine kinase/CheY-like chemotaxis protein/HPt (histidine-containing phosphotransfer) domain-containing protein